MADIKLDGLTVASSSGSPTVVNIDSDVASRITAKGIAKAWVNFDGTNSFSPNPSTSAIGSSFNVSSIFSHGTGQYSINFINNMSDTDYSVQVSVKGDIDFNNNSGVARISFINSLSTGSVRVHTGYMAQATRDYQNFPIICVVVFGS